MEWISGNVFIRPLAAPDGAEPGFTFDGHQHNFAHTSIFFVGRWRVRRWYPAVDEAGLPLRLADNTPAFVLTDDFEREAPFHLLIEPSCRHAFSFVGVTLPQWMEPFLERMAPDEAEAFKQRHAKSLGKAWCIYAHRSPQGDVTQHATGWPAAYA